MLLIESNFTTLYSFLQWITEFFSKIPVYIEFPDFLWIMLFLHLFIGKNVKYYNISYEILCIYFLIDIIDE